MNRRAVTIGLAILLPFAAFLSWWFYTFELVPGEVDLPMRGEARYNPLFALKKTLQIRGLQAESRGNLNLLALELKPDDTLLLDSDVRTLTHAQVTLLLQWVDQGGHLLFALPPGAEGRGGPLLDALDLSVTTHYGCLEWQAQTGIGSLCTRYRFEIDDAAEFDWLWGSAADGYVFGRQTAGKGSWLVASSFDFLGNHSLNTAGNAALAWQVLAPAIGTGKVYLVYAADVLPLHVLIVTYGWPIVLPLLLALLAWLWACSQRFGPLLPPAAAHRRALLEHVQAAGEFVFRRGRGLALYAAVRRVFVERLRRNDPAFVTLDGDALVQALVTRYGVAAAEIRQALNPVDLGRPDQFVATIKTLAQLRPNP